MLKEFRPYRATRRWPCVIFFDLIALSTQASLVLFCLKYPDDQLTKAKDRKKFLYKLGIQLVRPLVQSRQNSTHFRYLSMDIKCTINSICEVQSTKPTIRKVTQTKNPSLDDNSVQDTSNQQDTSNNTPSDLVGEAPQSSSLISSENAPNNSNLAQVPLPTPPELDSNTTVTNPILSNETIYDDLSQLGDNPQSSMGNTPSFGSIQLHRVGRCHYCRRNKDRKTKKRCEACAQFICHNHSKVLFLCLECQENFSLHWWTYVLEIITQFHFQKSSNYFQRYLLISSCSQ